MSNAPVHGRVEVVVVVEGEEDAILGLGRLVLGDLEPPDRGRQRRGRPGAGRRRAAFGGERRRDRRHRRDRRRGPEGQQRRLVADHLEDARPLRGRRGLGARRGRGGRAEREERVVRVRRRGEPLAGASGAAGGARRAGRGAPGAWARSTESSSTWSQVGVEGRATPIGVGGGISSPLELAERTTSPRAIHRVCRMWTTVIPPHRHDLRIRPNRRHPVYRHNPQGSSPAAPSCGPPPIEPEARWLAMLSRPA